MADLSRFLNAQARDYETALREIRAGHKRSHWIWYIFPQLEGLGYSGTAQYYAIRGREEAEAYTDSLRNLRMAYLKSQYLAHTEKAEAMMQAGDMTYLEELNEVKRIKDEMDGM